MTDIPAFWLTARISILDLLTGASLAAAPMISSFSPADQQQTGAGRVDQLIGTTSLADKQLTYTWLVGQLTDDPETGSRPTGHRTDTANIKTGGEIHTS